MPQQQLPDGPHRDKFKGNTKEIERLIEIHTEVSGKGKGYKHNVEVLNKSAIVLLVATWESYVEDLAENSFDFLLENCQSPEDIPRKIRAQASKSLKNSKTDLDVWKLAQDGWREVLESHKDGAIKKYVKTLNTPRTSNVDELFENLIGIRSISSNWLWKGMSKTNANSKLEKLITLRGEIAHTVSTAKPVSKAQVVQNMKFLIRLATISHNRCTKQLLSICGKQPWVTYRYEKTS